MSDLLRLTRPLAAASLLAGLPICSGAAETGPFYEGGYVAPLMSYVIPKERPSDGKDERLDSGVGGMLAFGYRKQNWALELAGYQVKLDGKLPRDAEPTMIGGSLNGLYFPFTRLPNLYGIATVGGGRLMDYPIVTPQPTKSNTVEDLPLTRFGGGVGYVLPFSIGRYAFGIRTEVLYVVGNRDEKVSELPDIDAPRRINAIVLNAGLQLPFGLKPAESEPEPVRMVEPATGDADADADGVLDNGDQCPGTPAGDKVDARGCSLPPPPPPCKTPAPGERVSLAGCGTGDIIVLRGVNFESDQARLTADAEAILDDVGEELVANPAIEIELSGHTDSLGGDAYNQRLSEQRARATMDYLQTKGVAAARMTAAGFGESRPIADNESVEGRQSNRRVELRITAGTAKAQPSAADSAEPAAADAPSAPAEPASEEAPVDDLESLTDPGAASPGL